MLLPEQQHQQQHLWIEDSIEGKQVENGEAITLYHSNQINSNLLCFGSITILNAVEFLFSFYENQIPLINRYLYSVHFRIDYAGKFIACQENCNA